MGCAPSAPAAAAPAYSAPPHAPAPPHSGTSASLVSGASQQQGTLHVKVPVNARPGMAIQLKTPYGQTLQVTVPPGVGPGSVMAVNYPLPQNRATVVNEELEGKTVAAHVLPTYWTNVSRADSSFDQMIYINQEGFSTFNELFSETYRAKATQDRKCPTGACPRTPGGCPCVRPGGDPGMPVGYKVRRVIRVEDSEIWCRYVEKREKIQANRTRTGDMPCTPLDPPARTDEVADKYENTFEPLDSTINEVYLWHGTNVRGALSIAQNDFSIDLAGSSTGTMYGRGAYFAENCSKSDEYATDEPGFYEGIFAMVLCRVVLGKFYYTMERAEHAGERVKEGHFDSTVGDRLKKADTFREFVVYDADAVYPEYVVLYSRVYAQDDPAEVETLSEKIFHMQLPVYWNNCYKDPSKEVFHMQYLVRKYVINLLQELIDACFKANGKVKLRSATRIENSAVWHKYSQYKMKLMQDAHRSRLSRFTAPQDLDEHMGNILTHTFLSAQSTEDCISISNLEESLNEHLLFHGTTKEAAENIAKDDFRIPVGKDIKHAARFGNGAYLAEDFEKALSYTEASSSNRRYVLLCRALCGDFYYTEAHTKIDAAQKRDEAKKHSVLANPEKQGPREFIVASADQVYPEFILELEVTDWTPPAPARMRATTMEMVVPQGSLPGSHLKVITPDGREVLVAVPANASPGAKIQIQV